MYGRVTLPVRRPCKVTVRSCKGEALVEWRPQDVVEHLPRTAQRVESIKRVKYAAGTEVRGSEPSNPLTLKTQTLDVEPQDLLLTLLGFGLALGQYVLIRPPFAPLPLSASCVQRKFDHSASAPASILSLPPAGSSP